MAHAGAFELWFKRPKPNPSASFRLFCFPFAGGNTLTYYSWSNDLPADFELCALQLPGREHRFKEKPFDQLLPLIEVLAEIIQLRLDKPFAFFGHSIGALISFELAHHLHHKKLPAPAHLFVSSWRAPHLINSNPAMHQMSEPRLIQELKRFNGTPEVVLQEPELMEIFLPIIRADFKMFETYVYQDKHPISSSITAYGGIRDTWATRKHLEAWCRHTSNKFRLKMFQGGHFYFNRRQQKLIGEIVRDLRDYL